MIFLSHNMPNRYKFATEKPEYMLNYSMSCGREYMLNYSMSCGRVTVELMLQWTIENIYIACISSHLEWR